MQSMHWIFKILLLVFWMIIIPTAAGNCMYADGKKSAKAVDGGLVLRWVSGQMLLWALFQVLCVPMVLTEMSFRYLVYAFGGISLILAIYGTYVAFKRTRNDVLKPVSVKRDNMLPWIIFGLILVFQLVQAVRLTYGDGDDAYYVAVSTITENAETMYSKLPYTGGTTELDIRHGLAPFPVWIAFLSKVSGLRAVSAAHVAVPLMLIPMTYAIFYLIGRSLFKGKEKFLPVFLIFTEILVIFGDYSFYTVENFMLARSRQGKAALGSIVMPMLFFLLFVLLERMQKNEKYGLNFWILLCCVMTTGCLCSTLGGFLLCLLLAVTGLCAAVCYRKWKVLAPLALCCAPCVFYALIYLAN